MTLHAFEAIEQGSKEWHDQRRGMVTASVVGQLLTPTLKVASNDVSRGLTALLVAERITGHTDETFTNADMWRGVMDEPVARALYSKHYAPVAECGFMVRDLDNGARLGYSPDGLVGNDGLIEIKSRRSKTQLVTIIRDDVPAPNMGQLQAGLLVSGRDYIDYVSYAAGMPFYVKRMLPDPAWFEAITAACAAFEVLATEMTSRYLDSVTDLIPTERTDYGTEITF